jgi:hypothetical protein
MNFVKYQNGSILWGWNINKEPPFYNPALGMSILPLFLFFSFLFVFLFFSSFVFCSSFLFVSFLFVSFLSVIFRREKEGLYLIHYSRICARTKQCGTSSICNFHSSFSGQPNVFHCFRFRQCSEFYHNVQDNKYPLHYFTLFFASWP